MFLTTINKLKEDKKKNESLIIIRNENLNKSNGKEIDDLNKKTCSDEYIERSSIENKSNTKNLKSLDKKNNDNVKKLSSFQQILNIAIKNRNIENNKNDVCLKIGNKNLINSNSIYSSPKDCIREDYSCKNSTPKINFVRIRCKNNNERSNDEESIILSDINNRNNKRSSIKLNNNSNKNRKRVDKNLQDMTEDMNENINIGSNEGRKKKLKNNNKDKDEECNNKNIKEIVRNKKSVIENDENRTKRVEERKDEKNKNGKDKNEKNKNVKDKNEKDKNGKNKNEKDKNEKDKYEKDRNEQNKNGKDKNGINKQLNETGIEYLIEEKKKVGSKKEIKDDMKIVENIQEKSKEFSKKRKKKFEEKEIKKHDSKENNLNQNNYNILSLKTKNTLIKKKYKEQTNIDFFSNMLLSTPTNSLRNEVVDLELNYINEISLTPNISETSLLKTGLTPINNNETNSNKNSRKKDQIKGFENYYLSPLSSCINNGDDSSKNSSKDTIRKTIGDILTGLESTKSKGKINSKLNCLKQNKFIIQLHEKLSSDNHNGDGNNINNNDYNNKHKNYSNDLLETKKISNSNNSDLNISELKVNLDRALDKESEINDRILDDEKDQEFLWSINEDKTLQNEDKELLFQELIANQNY